MAVTMSQYDIMLTIALVLSSAALVLGVYASYTAYHLNKERK
jgi:hypothetical protein